MKIKSTFQLPKKQFTVYEDEWVNGGNKGGAKFCARDYKGESALLNDKGNRCCVGFLAQASGLEDSAIADRGYLDDILKFEITKKSLKSIEKISAKLMSGVSDVSDFGGPSIHDHPSNIYAINDTDSVTNEVRKTKLKEQFRKQLGLEVIFKPTRPNKKRDENKSKQK